MIPTKLYREQDGGVYDTLGDAYNQSVESAASDLRNLLKSENGDFTSDGDKLIAIRAEIKRSLKILNQALEGKLITEYKIEK
jgi:hypothetical protein